jgi:hypothetical protein
MHICFTLPSKERATRLEAFIQSIIGSYNKGKHTATFAIGVDADDVQLPLYQELAQRYPCVTLMTLSSPWQGLGMAFNEIIRSVLKDPAIEVVTMVGDDMLFQNNADKIFDYIEECFNKCANDKLGVVSFNCNYPVCPIIAINGFVHRNWIECFGYFIPEVFYGDYSDNWLTDMAMQLKRWFYNSEFIIQHNHGYYNTAARDPAYYRKLQYDSKRSDRSANIYAEQSKLYPSLIQKAHDYQKAKNTP